jgi:hypothetical protein
MADDLTKIQEMSPEERAERMEALAIKADVDAINTLKGLMTKGESERTRLDAATSWLNHRREARRIVLQLDSDNAKPMFNFNFNSGVEESNARGIIESISGDE